MCLGGRIDLPNKTRRHLCTENHIRPPAGRREDVEGEGGRRRSTRWGLWMSDSRGVVVSADSGDDEKTVSTVAPPKPTTAIVRPRAVTFRHKGRVGKTTTAPLSSYAWSRGGELVRGAWGGSAFRNECPRLLERWRRDVDTMARVDMYARYRRSVDAPSMRSF